ncbi:MAG: recombinase family protein [Oscillospiraceae bacterium]|nr:recombinase family protein [Oscillospiraceae bacterium]
MAQKFNYGDESPKVVYRTALYLRLSQEDGDKRESDSIANQRKLLEDYIRDRGEFKYVGEYVDDGYSGSNFDRPSWKRLYRDLESGLVNCILVKDLSRFGRNYIEVGRYLEMTFPAMGVRLVAINDGFDTAEEKRSADLLTVPMKNLINDYYCREISRKITTQLSAMRKRGECVMSFVPYGYKKSPQDRSRLIVDESAAPTVRQIFDWKLEGYGNRTIADRLNESGILSPYEYQTERGVHVSGNFKRNPKALWGAGSVYNILHNECYTGTLVQGKYRKLSYRSDERVLLPKDEWTRVAGTHEAIVEPNLFEQVQEIMQREIKTTGGECAATLSGFLFCDVCGRQMTIKSTYRGDKIYRYYKCKDCERAGRSSVRISEKKATAGLLRVIRQMALSAYDIEHLDFLPEDSEEVKSLDRELLSLEEEMDRCGRLKDHLFGDYSAGVLTRSEYMDYSKLYTDKIERAKQDSRAVSKKRSRLVSEIADASWLESFKKYRDIDTLQRKVMCELVDKVYVGIGGHMDIRFRHDSAIRARKEAAKYEESGLEAAI